MTNLTRYQQGELELLINSETGECFAGKNAIARMCNVSVAAITKYAGVNQIYPKQAQVPTGGGVQGVNLFDENAINGFLLKYNPMLLAKCAKLGLRIYLHKIAGFEVRTIPPQEFNLPQTMQEALRLAADEMDKRIAAERERDRLKLQAAEDKPHTELGRAIAFSEDAVSIGDFAKMIGTGRNRLFVKLREMNIVMQNSTIPYQRYIEAGYFEVSQEINVNNGKLIPFALLTGKGQLWLQGKLKKRKEIQQKAIAAISQGVLDLTL